MTMKRCYPYSSSPNSYYLSELPKKDIMYGIETDIIVYRKL